MPSVSDVFDRRTGRNDQPSSRTRPVAARPHEAAAHHDGQFLQYKAVMLETMEQTQLTGSTLFNNSFPLHDPTVQYIRDVAEQDGVLQMIDVDFFLDGNASFIHLVDVVSTVVDGAMRVVEDMF